MTLKCDHLLEEAAEALLTVPTCQGELGGEYRLVLLRGDPRTDALGRLWATCNGGLGMPLPSDKDVFQPGVSDSRHAWKVSAMLLVRKRRGEACIEEGLLQGEALSRDEVVPL